MPRFALKLLGALLEAQPAWLAQSRGAAAIYISRVYNISTISSRLARGAQAWALLAPQLTCF